MRWLRTWVLLFPFWVGCGSPGGDGGNLSFSDLNALGGQLTPDSAGNIVEANFTGRPLGDPDLVVIARYGSIQKLWLTNTGVTDTGLVHLQTMPNLRVLGLARTSVTDAGLPALGRIRSLREVYLYPNRVTDSAVDALKQQLPGIKIVY